MLAGLVVGDAVFAPRLAARWGLAPSTDAAATPPEGYPPGQVVDGYSEANLFRVVPGTVRSPVSGETFNLVEAFAETGDGLNLYAVNAHGTIELGRNVVLDAPVITAPNGKFIAFCTMGPSKAYTVQVVPIGTTAWRTWVQGSGAFGQGAITQPAFQWETSPQPGRVDDHSATLDISYPQAAGLAPGVDPDHRNPESVTVVWHPPASLPTSP